MERGTHVAEAFDQNSLVLTLPLFVVILVRQLVDGTGAFNVHLPDLVEGLLKERLVIVSRRHIGFQALIGVLKTVVWAFVAKAVY